MSGYPDTVASRLGRLGPGASFLPKPFTIDELLQAVRKALASRVGGRGPGSLMPRATAPGAHEASPARSTLASRRAVVDRTSERPAQPGPLKRLVRQPR